MNAAAKSRSLHILALSVFVLSMFVAIFVIRARPLPYPCFPNERCMDPRPDEVVHSRIGLRLTVAGGGVLVALLLELLALPGASAEKYSGKSPPPSGSLPGLPRGYGDGP
ncbi:MAG TPA: hypothetical protein VK977_10155 [Actinomycetota bacterium]|nr:hypothetical protein [Actinomycetota bacterium]